MDELQATQGVPTWLVIAISIVSLLLGSGGLAAILKVRHDERMGVGQQELAEDTALDARWKSIIETQTISLLEPLRVRLADVEKEVRAVKEELDLSRRKYWSAISYIRTLYTWMSRHLPDDIEQTQIPAPPAALAEDL